MRHGDGRSLLQTDAALQTARGIHASLLPLVAPNLAALQLLHSSTDGYVSFASKSSTGTWCELASVPVTALAGDAPQPWLPELMESLTTNGYATVNTMWRPGRRTVTHERYVPAVIEGQRVRVLQSVSHMETHVPDSPGLLLPYRDATGVRWLTAAWADCDGYNVGLDAPATVAGLMRAWRAGVIPQPSAVLASGRGAWAFWKLIDERAPRDGVRQVVGKHGAVVELRPDSPLQASSYARRVHRAVNLALAERLVALGADVASTDAARVCRVPGSLHGETGEHVELLPVLSRGGMKVYTLAELASFLGVSDAVASPRQRASGSTLSTRQLAQRIRALQARHRRVHVALLELSDVRGGYRQGHRHHALFYAALHGVLAGLPTETVRAAIRHVGAAAHPPCSPSDVAAVIASARKKALGPWQRPISYRAVAERVCASLTERHRVGLVARSRTRTRPAPAERHVVIHQLVAELHRTGRPVPPLVEMAELLTARGLPVSKPTVARDYAQLGITSGAKGGRPRLLLLPLNSHLETGCLGPLPETVSLFRCK